MNKPKRKEVFLTKIVSVSSMGNIYGVISMKTKVLIFNQKYTLINKVTLIIMSLILIKGIGTAPEKLYAFP